MTTRSDDLVLFRLKPGEQVPACVQIKRLGDQLIARDGGWHCPDVDNDARGREQT